MKHLKFFTYLINILLFSYNAISQPWLQIGNTVGTSDYLGSNNSASVNFMVNATTTNPNYVMQLNTNGNVGIGNYNSYTPLRQLDVFQNNNDPQLRLTYTSNLGSHIFTDFLTDGSGNLIITPTNNSSPGNIGINVTTPTEMLDVYGNGRFENIPNASGSNYSFVLAQNSAGSYPGTLAGIDFSTLAQKYFVN